MSAALGRFLETANNFLGILWTTFARRHTNEFEKKALSATVVYYRWSMSPSNSSSRRVSFRTSAAQYVLNPSVDELAVQRPPKYVIDARKSTAQIVREDAGSVSTVKGLIAKIAAVYHAATNVTSTVVITAKRSMIFAIAVPLTAKTTLAWIVQRLQTSVQMLDVRFNATTAVLVGSVMTAITTLTFVATRIPSNAASACSDIASLVVLAVLSHAVAADAHSAMVARNSNTVVSVRSVSVRITTDLLTAMHVECDTVVRVDAKSFARYVLRRVLKNASVRGNDQLNEQRLPSEDFIMLCW